MAVVLDTRTTCLRAWRLTSWKPSTTQSIASRASYGSFNKPSRAPQPCSRELSSRPRTISIPTNKQLQASFSNSRFASSSASAPRSSTSTAHQLTWDRFFDLRKKRRYINLVASITTAAGSVVIAGPLLAAQDVDTWGAQLTGIDPVFVLGASTLAVGAVGWLCGPTFGNLVFRGWAGRRGWNGLIAQVCISGRTRFHDARHRY